MQWGDAEEISGGRDSSRRLPRSWALVIAAALACAALVGAWFALPRPVSGDPAAGGGALTVERVEVVDANLRAVPDAEDGGAPGALGVPAGSSLPAARVRLTVVNAGRDSAALGPVAGLRMGVERSALAPGERGEVTATISPYDCSTTVEGGLAPLASSLCAGAPGVWIRLLGAQGPRSGRSNIVDVPIEVVVDDRAELKASLGGHSREPTRVVLTPLDGGGLRGLGSTELVIDDRRASTHLLWTADSSAEAGPLKRRVQVFVIVGGIAYPRVVTLGSSDTPA